MLKFWKNTEGGYFGTYAATMAVAVAVFCLKFTPHVLNPYHFDWLMSYGDMPTEYVSWLYYRATPTTFPVVGTLSGYDYPTVTGVGLTGAMPLLAIPIKWFTQSQTVDFQYFGWWFLFCYLLQAYFSVRLLKSLASQYAIRNTQYELFLGSVFIALSPALLTRTGHMNLCGQWLILWSFCAYFENRNFKETALAFLKIALVTALIHQYLLVMVFGIAFAALIKSEEKGKFKTLKVVVANLLNIAVAAAAWFVAGNFNSDQSGMEQIGFGKFSANLNTFFNGLGEQKLLPTLPYNEGQYEGFGYLGFGALVLVVISLVFYFYSKFSTKATRNSPIAESTTSQSHNLQSHNLPISNLQSPILPLSIIALVFALFAFSNIFTFGKTTVLTLKTFYENIGFVKFLSNAFRASGRFIWVAHYLILVGAIIGFYKINLSKLLKISVLAILLALQIADISPMFTREKAYFDNDGYAPSVMTPTVWTNIIAEADRVVMLPPYAWDYADLNDYIHFARLTALQRKPITTGYLARPDWKAHIAYEKNLLENLKNGSLAGEENSIFIANKASTNKLKRLSETGLVQTFQYQNYTIVIPTKFSKTIQYLSQLAGCQPFTINVEGLTEFLKAQTTEGGVLLAVVRDDAAFKLCDDARKAFENMNSAASQLTFRGSYIGIFVDGKKVYDKMTGENAKIVEKIPPQYLKGTGIKTLEMESAGALSGNAGRIIVDGKNTSPEHRGFNFVVLDKNGKILKTAFFDTFDDCYTGEVK